jgi:hypothetical protein
MWKHQEEKQENLLKELCGNDTKLCEFLSSYLCENPLEAISPKGLDILTGEGERSGNFRPAMDKAIFESAQNPAEREHYVKVIQDLASKSIHATEQEQERVAKTGLTSRVASLAKRIDDQKFMSERARDVIDVASKFYSEKLVQLGENARRETRAVERRIAEGEGRRVEILEEGRREARATETRGMGGAEKKEAEKQARVEDQAAKERKEARGEETTKAQTEERRIADLEKAGREARGKERRGS